MPRENSLRKLLHNDRVNRKFGEERAYLRHRLQRATCYSYKFPDYKFSAEDEKYYIFTL